MDFTLLSPSPSVLSRRNILKTLNCILFMFLFSHIKVICFSYCRLLCISLLLSNNLLIPLDIHTPTHNSHLLSNDTVQRSIAWRRRSSLMVFISEQRDCTTPSLSVFSVQFFSSGCFRNQTLEDRDLSPFFSTLALRQVIQLPLLSYKTQPEQGDGCVNGQSSESGLQRAHLRGAQRVVSTAQSI